MVIEPWYWLAFGVLLITVEMLVPTFASLWFGIAAIVTGLLAWVLPISLYTQISIWLILSIICVIAWFKFIQPKVKDKTKSGLGGSVIVGEVGILTQKPVDNHAGTIRFSVPIVGATEWQCRSKDESLNVGDRVVVTEILGNEVIVSAVN